MNLKVPARRALAALAVLWAAGCGGADGRVPVSGRLVDGGKPFAFDQSKVKLPPGATGLPPGSNPVTVLFTPAEGGEASSAMLSLTDGTFTVPGKDGKGLKPGKYKVAVTGGAGGGAPDYFGGKFTADKTQIVKDVQPGQEVVIDVAKPAG
jgi:hypothetical protein